MRQAEIIVRSLLESDPPKGRVIAFGMGMPRLGATAFSIDELFQRLREYGAARQTDPRELFSFFYTDNDAVVRHMGVSTRLSEEQWDEVTKWLGVDQHTSTVMDGNNEVSVDDFVQAGRGRGRFAGERSAQERPTDSEVYIGLTYHAKTLPPVVINSAGPGLRAGIKEDDQIIRINGKSVAEPGELAKVVAKLKPDQPVRFTVKRNGALYGTWVTPQSAVEDDLPDLP